LRQLAGLSKEIPFVFVAARPAQALDIALRGQQIQIGSDRNLRYSEERTEISHMGKIARGDNLEHLHISYLRMETIYGAQCIHEPSSFELLLDE
jgi:hypothetical protein